MSYYYFADVSHHKGDLDIQTFADAGHRICISKASDNYNLPDKDGKYYWNPQRHYDSRFVDNYVNTRAVGLVAGAYHFARFDRPLGADIVLANLEYFKDAIAMLPPEQRDVRTAVIDMEQSGTQLQAAGLSKAKVSNMARGIVEAFEAEYEHLILYSGSWWSDEWLTRETTAWMAQRMSVWEPEYVSISDNKPRNVDYAPSVPYGFSNEYAVTADDMVGKMFAWQFSAGGRFPGITSNIDINQTMMPKDELYKLFHQDGSVDPPEPPPNDCFILGAVRDLLQSGIDLINGVCQ